jgi:AcrR family transcriptional regulator
MVFMSSSSSSSSDLPEPPWSSLRGRKPARRPITRDAMVDASLRIVDAEGLDALSMRRLAQELGCQASALYAHVSGKPELLQLLIDRVAGEVRIPEPDPERWQEQVKDAMRAIHGTLVAHRDLAGASLANIPTGPNALVAIDGLLALLRAGGLSRRVAALAADLLPLYVTATAYEGSLFARRIEQEPDYFQRLDDYFRSLPPERFPVLHELLDELTDPGDSPEDRFEFGLEVLLRGLAAMRDPAEP